MQQKNADTNLLDKLFTSIAAANSRVKSLQDRKIKAAIERQKERDKILDSV